MLSEAKPRQALSVIDAVAIVVGMVVGVGIFKTPSIVASSTESESIVLLFWLLGGLASFVGALCYAELMSTYPHAGGDYHYLNRAFGSASAFLYAWARMAVIQTGSIAMVAFLVGDYASEILRLGRLSTSIYAALTIIILTAVNVAGIRQGKWTQKTFVAFILLGLFVASAIGILMAGQQTVFPDGNVIPRKESLGTAMIFVLLTYGGWNEASFLSAEVRSGRHNMLKVLIYSIGVVTVIYLLVNIALLKNLGRPDMAASSTVMADMIGKMFGKVGSNLTSLLILIAAVSTMNAAIITGARTSYALGQDYSILGFLGRWHGLRHTPVNALLLQGVIALVLVVLGTGTHDGFVMMVEYTAPVFWLFFLMVGVSIFLLRHKEPNAHRPFMIPLYPLPLLVFCAICLFMLYSSVAFTRGGSFIGVCVLLTGTPLMILQKKRRLKDKNILTKLNERDDVQGGKHDQSDR